MKSTRESVRAILNIRGNALFVATRLISVSGQVDYGWIISTFGLSPYPNMKAPRLRH
jgi:hypothetical protein